MQRHLLEIPTIKRGCLAGITRHAKLLKGSGMSPGDWGESGHLGSTPVPRENPAAGPDPCQKISEATSPGNLPSPYLWLTPTVVALLILLLLSRRNSHAHSPMLGVCMHKRAVKTRSACMQDIQKDILLACASKCTIECTRAL
jgi:hypothetical protein